MYNGLLTPTTRFEGSFKLNISLPVPPNISVFGFYSKNFQLNSIDFCYFIVIQIKFKETGLKKPGRGD